jgi:hypothetical protein
MKNIGLVLLALALLGVSVLAYRHLSREQRQSQDFPDGAHWFCGKCQQGFTVSLDAVHQWANSDPAGGYPCPKCKAIETFRAKKCPLAACGRYYTDRNLVIDEKPSCPVCKKPLP